MLDCLTQVDEVKVLRNEIEAYGKIFKVSLNSEFLNENEIQVCDVIENHSSLDGILDNSSLSDKETAEILLRLLKKVIVVRAD